MVELLRLCCATWKSQALADGGTLNGLFTRSFVGDGGLGGITQNGSCSSFLAKLFADLVKVVDVSLIKWLTSRLTS